MTHRLEAAAAATCAVQRLAWSWVVLSGVLEIALLVPLAGHQPQLGIDLAALAVTAVLAVAVTILPRVALRMLDAAEERASRTAGE